MLPAQSSSAFLPLKEMVKTLPDPVIVFEGNSTVQYANKAAKQLFQYTKHELQGRHISYLLSSDSELKLQSFLDRQTPFSGTVHKALGQCKNGMLFPLGLSVSGYSNEGQDGFVTTFYDERPVKQAEESIIQQGRFSRKCLRNTNYLFTLMKASTLEVLLTSERAQTILGYMSQELLGKSYLYTVHPDDHERIKRVFESALSKYPEPFLSLVRVRRVHKSGQTPVMEVSVNCVKDPVTNEMYLVTVGKDITVHVDEEQKHIQRVIAKNIQESNGIITVASLILHELRNPLAGIQYETETMKALANSERLSEQMGKAEQSCSKVAHLLNTFLAISQIQADKFRLTKIPFSLSHVVNRVVASVSACEEVQNKIQLHANIDPSVPDVQIGDCNKLDMVLETLIQHCISQLQTGQALTLTVKPTERTQGFILFQLTDTRSSISQSESELYQLLNEHPSHQIFLSDVFTSIEKTIQRMDLVVCKSVLQLMGGSLHFFYDQPPYGFVCQFLIPCIASTDRRDVLELSALQVQNYEGYFTQLNLKVLCVDDNVFNNKVTKRLWQRLGCTDCDTALSGKEALERVERKKYDVIMLDYMMPEMNGKQAAQLIRSKESARQAIILLCSGLSLSESSEEFTQVGVDGFLIKPPTTAMIVEACATRLFNRA